MNKKDCGRINHWKSSQTWLYGKISIILLIVVVLVYNLLQYDYQLNRDGLNQLSSIWKQFFTPVSYSTIYNDNLWVLSLESLLLTLSHLLLGTITGFVLAIITAWLSSNNNRWVILRSLVKLLIMLLWTLPTPIFIELFRQGFLPNTASMLIFSWFSWLWLNQYFLGLFNSLDYRYYHYLIHYQKYSNLKAIYYGVITPIRTKLVVYFLYAVESNLRWSTVLGPLGVVGIGQLISEPLNADPQHFDQIMIPLFILFLVLIGFELIILTYQKSLNKTYYPQAWKKIQPYEQYARKINWFKVGFFLMIIGLLIFSFINLNYQPVNHQRINYLLQEYFNFQWPNNNIHHPEHPIRLLIDLFSKAINVALLGMIFGVIFGLLSSPKITKPMVSYGFLIINTWFRLWPSIVVFYLLNPLFIDNQALVIIVLVIHNSATFSKKINFLLAAQNTDQIKIYHQLGYSKLWLICYYLWPLTKQEWRTYWWIHFQSIMRTLVVFGIFGGGSLMGVRINNLMSRGLIGELGPYFLVLWLGLMSLELFRYQIIHQISQQIIKLSCKIKFK